MKVYDQRSPPPPTVKSVEQEFIGYIIGVSILFVSQTQNTPYYFYRLSFEG